MPGNAGDIFVAGDHAYVADQGDGLQVIDISDPIRVGENNTYVITVENQGSSNISKIGWSRHMKFTSCCPFDADRNQ